MRLNKAFTLLEVIVVIGLIGAGAAYLFPKVFNKDSRNAAQSQDATQKLLQAQKEKEANISASVTVIGQANANSPDSKEKDFIGREVPLVLGQLAPPNQKALIDAANRRAAIAEGKAALANELYGVAASKAEALQKKVDDGIRERQEIDLKLSEAAAYKLGAERTQMAMGAIILILAGLFAYAKIYGIHTDSVGSIIADIRSGVNPIQAIDTHLGPRLHARVQKAARLATPSQ